MPLPLAVAAVAPACLSSAPSATEGVGGWAAGASGSGVGNRSYPEPGATGDSKEDPLDLTDNNLVFAGAASAKRSLTTLVQAAGTLGFEQGPARVVERWMAIENILP
jgi:hypothetical protein